MSIDKPQHHSAQVRQLIAQAAEQVSVKERELGEALRAQRLLRHQVALLAAIADDDAELVPRSRQLALRALVLKHAGRVPLPMAMPEVSFSFSDAMQPSGPTLRMDTLPLSFNGYDDTLLQRLAAMTPGDALQAYQGFLAQAQPLVVSADCHGEASPFYPELRQLVQRFLNYGAVHSIVALPMLSRYCTSNLLTGEENAVPEGWYERVAQQLPVHKELAQIIRAGLALLEGFNNKNSKVQAGQYSQLALESALVEPLNDLLNVEQLEKLLADCRRTYTWTGGTKVSLTSVQIMTHIFTQMMELEDLPIHKVALVLTTCWPFSIFRQKILEGYIRRPDVAAVLDAEDSKMLLSLAPSMVSELPMIAGVPDPMQLQRDGRDGRGAAGRPRAQQRQA